MLLTVLLVFLNCFVSHGKIMDATTCPTLYEYYTQPSITSGLSACDQNYFKLNNKTITIYSGALHYFRVPKAYWRDRLRKIRAAGLNTVETYIPWNLHEYQEGVFDFGNGGSDFEEFLDVKEFLVMAKEEDLFAIVRPGPYICSEWDFGGMPSWLLRYEGMKIRTSDEKFMSFVSNYFKVLFKILSELQFTKGGPIIAFQIENEYGNVKIPNEPIDTIYLQKLKTLFEENNLVELLFTSDTPSNGNYGSLPGVLYTANFQTDTKKELDLLREYQKDKPIMVMEFWSGWFDHWSEKHHVVRTEDFSRELATILDYPASVNFYMFHGGTNWGFLNGANILENGDTVFDTSSYDYDAPLSEDGSYTEKYYALKKLIEKRNLVKIKNPDLPELTPKIKYEDVKITHQLTLFDIINNNQLKSAGSYKNLTEMEMLNINNNSGQSYGYVIYRKQNLNIRKNSTISIKGSVRDTLMILINGELKTKIPHSYKDSIGKSTSLDLGNEDLNNATLDLVVENWGRVNYGKLHQFNQKKGLWDGGVYINDDLISDYEIFPLEFKKSWIKNLNNWNVVRSVEGPVLYKAELVLKKDVRDTFVDSRKWVKGVFVVNGFVLSRYFKAGPQQSAYLPAPFLKKGVNEILIFEHFIGADTLSFSDVPIFETVETF